MVVAIWVVVADTEVVADGMVVVADTAVVGTVAMVAGVVATVAPIAADGVRGRLWDSASALSGLTARMNTPNRYPHAIGLMTLGAGSYRYVSDVSARGGRLPFCEAPAMGPAIGSLGKIARANSNARIMPSTLH